MDRVKFRKFFKCPGPAVLPVVHVMNYKQTKRNILVAISEGAQGVFLINHDFSYHQLLPVVREIRREFPYLWLGVNFLGVTGEEAFPVLGQLQRDGVQVDGYWADSACIEERADDQSIADRIKDSLKGCGWEGLYFGGVAFKAQRLVADGNLEKAAATASQYMDVVTTSGRATGKAASLQKIADIRRGCGSVAMAVASGVTPSNASEYAPLVDCFMVATGISPPGDFYNFDPMQLRALLKKTRSHIFHPLTPSHPPQPLPSHTHTTPRDPWYLDLIASNTKGDKYAWLDPTAIYLDGKAFQSLTSDLLTQVNPADFDLVAGIDAMGFPLAAAIASQTGKGFLAIRKGGKLCVDTDEVEYNCYSGTGKKMEMRKNAFPTGTKLFLVDQWMETGGTMDAAIRLIEGQGGVVVAIATINCETNRQTQELRLRYKLVHVVPADKQQLFDQHQFKPRGRRSN